MGKATRRAVLGRDVNDVRARAATPLSLDELLALLDDPAKGDAGSREHAIACFLSGSDGWKDAVKQLDGTFAKGAAELRERKED
jgi:hypothetical protein